MYVKRRFPYRGLCQLQLDSLREERKKWLTWKNIAPGYEAIQKLPNIDNIEIDYGDTFTINALISDTDKAQIIETAKLIKPWRKGPFNFFGEFIDTEWRSNLKYNLLMPHVDLKDKVIADVGCNNAYYMFRMLADKPKRVVGFDPSAQMYLQYLFINHFVKSDMEYELLGIEHVEFHEHKFDLIFCLGVLYHRSDPIEALKSLYRSLNAGGEVVIDTMIIEGEDDVCLFPKDRYAAMRNVYFLPTIPALKNWLSRAGFIDIELIEIKKTDFEEQRKTEWIDSHSLNNFLKSDDITTTIEGYPAPIRAYMKARKKL
jgi:tRNA (mo5U34)-methyltransferase